MNNDRITAILCLAFSIFIVVSSKDFPFLGAIFPTVIAFTLGIMSIILLIKSYIKPELSEWAKNIKFKNVFIVSSGIIMYVVLIPFLGIVVTSTLFILVFSLFFSYDRGYKILFFNLFVSLCITGFISYIFISHFYVPLPSGYFF